MPETKKNGPGDAISKNVADGGSPAMSGHAKAGHGHTTSWEASTAGLQPMDEGMQKTAAEADNAIQNAPGRNQDHTSSSAGHVATADRDIGAWETGKGAQNPAGSGAMSNGSTKNSG